MEGDTRSRWTLGVLWTVMLAGSVGAPPGSLGAGEAIAAPTEAGVGVVARVNGEPVSRAEFLRRLANPLTRSQLREQAGGEASGPKSLEQLALRKSIHHRLMLQEAARRQIIITADELDAAIAALRRRFADLERFGKWMKDQDLDDRELFETVRGDMVAGRVFAALAAEVRVTDEEAQRYYEAQQEGVVIGEEVRLRIIAVDDRAAADEILASLRKGAAFRRLARARSRGRLAAKGGDTGWIDSKTLPDPLRKALPLLEPGDIAGPLEGEPDAFLLVGLEGRRPITAKSLAEARPEIERRLLPARQQAAVTTWLLGQEKDARIEILPVGKVQ